MKPILRSQRDAVSPVVAELLLVAITVVLAAVIYIMASGLLGSHSAPAPVIALAGPNPYSGGSFNTSFTVAGASQALTMVNYKFNLKVGQVYGNATTFAASGVAAPIVVGGTTYKVTWTDTDGGGTLTQGDLITISGKGVSLPATTNFDFILVFSDGNVLTHQAWVTP